MSALTELRTQLATVLGGLDITTYSHLPENAILPSAIVLAGSPYIESGQTFNENLVRFDIWISAAKGMNSSETVQSDELIEAAMDLLQGDGWTVETVSQPADLDGETGLNAYTVIITVTAPVTF